AAGLAIVLVPHVSTGWLLGGAGLLYLLWTTVLPAWVRRPQFVEVRFYAGGRGDEVPRSIAFAGEEDRIEVVRSITEERNGVRRRRFQVRTTQGERLELVAEDEPAARWRIERPL